MFTMCTYKQLTKIFISIIITICCISSYVIAEEPLTAQNEVDSTGTGVSLEAHQQSLGSLQREVELMSLQSSHGNASEASRPILLAPENMREVTFFTVHYKEPVRGSNYNIEVNDLEQANKDSSRGKIPGNALSIDPTDNTQKETDSKQKKLLFTLWPRADYDYIDSDNDGDLSMQESKAAFSELAESVNQLKKDFLISTTTLSKDEASSLDMSLINNFAGTINPQLDYNNLLNYMNQNQPSAASLENYTLSSLRPLTNTPETALESKDLRRQMESISVDSKSSSEAKIYKMAREVYENNLSDINNTFKQDLANIKNSVDSPVLIKNKGAVAALIRINKKSM